MVIISGKPSEKKLIGIDLDGVLVEERVNEYIQLKQANDIVGLQKYYLSLKLNEDFVNTMNEFSKHFDYRIFTARNTDLPNIRPLTRYYLDNNNLGHIPVTHTKFKWKAPELYYHGASAMIDNDWRSLRKVPFIKKMVYLQDIKALQDLVTNCTEMSTALFDGICYHPKRIPLLFDTLYKLCYNR